MNNLRNKVQLIGNIGNNPEIITIQNGKKIAKLSLATNEHFTDSKGEKKTITQWHNLEAWGKIAEIIEQFIKKGEEVAVDGKIVYENYDAKDGTKRYITKIKVNEILMLSGKA